MIHNFFKKIGPLILCKKRKLDVTNIADAVLCYQYVWSQRNQIYCESMIVIDSLMVAMLFGNFKKSKQK